MTDHPPRTASELGASSATGAAAPLVSIVMPVFNHARYLAAALQSIAAQTERRSELIVVDDGSGEPVAPIVEATLPGATVLRQANAGPSAARNRGIGKARGEFVGFLDADDLWHRRALERLLKGFRDAPTADVVQGHLVRFGTPPAAQPPGPDARQRPYRGFNVGAILVRRSLLDELGGFDQGLRRSEDVDLFIRLREAKARWLVLPETVLRYRQRPMASPAPERHALDPTAPDRWLPLLARSLTRRRRAPVPPPALPTADRPITVAIVVRDGMRHLPQALETVRAQTLAPADILAVVGPSEDGTLAHLRADGGIRVLEQRSTGLAGARNEAVAACRTPRLAFLDHDDLWRPEKLRAQSDAMDLFERPGASIVTFHEVGSQPELPAEPRGIPILGWTPSALMGDLEIFRTVGPFDPSLGMGTDADWFARLRDADLPVAVAGRALLWKRRHAAALSYDRARTRAAMLRVIAARRRRAAEAGPEG
jgi:glycosyltransferase involved in cell wall biosynthesis